MIVNKNELVKAVDGILDEIEDELDALEQEAKPLRAQLEELEEAKTLLNNYDGTITIQRERPYRPGQIATLKEMGLEHLVAVQEKISRNLYLDDIALPSLILERMETCES